jgi:hypothetical protein
LLIIVNTSQRIKTITRISVSISHNGSSNRNLEPVPANALFTEHVNFPQTIKVGEQIAFPLNRIIAEEYAKKVTAIRVYDAEGNRFTKFERHYINPKWGDTYLEKEVTRKKKKLFKIFK